MSAFEEIVINANAMDLYAAHIAEVGQAVKEGMIGTANRQLAIAVAIKNAVEWQQHNLPRDDDGKLTHRVRVRIVIDTVPDYNPVFGLSDAKEFLRVQP